MTQCMEKIASQISNQSHLKTKTFQEYLTILQRNMKIHQWQKYENLIITIVESAHTFTLLVTNIYIYTKELYSLLLTIIINKN